MQPNCVDFLHCFKPVNTSAEKRPVGQPKKKPVDQRLKTDLNWAEIRLASNYAHACIPKAWSSAHLWVWSN